MHLQAALAHAATGAPPDAFRDKLSLELAPPPPAGGEQPYAAWRRLRLRVDVGWPLQLLLDAPALTRYDEL